MAAPRTRNALIIGAVIVVALLAGGVVWYVSRDSPDEVDLDTATEQVRDRTTTNGAGSGESTPDGVEGTWTVDTESGEFDFETATGSFVGFRVEEQLANIGAATAVGRTGELTGTLTIDGTSVTEASFEVDLTTITTNESRRDRRVQEALHTCQLLRSCLRLSDFSPRCTARVFLHVLFAACCRICSLSAACLSLAAAPSRETVGKALHRWLPTRDELLRRLNRARVAEVPRALRKRPQRVAIDLVLIPYHGQPLVNFREVYRAQARSGTSQKPASSQRRPSPATVPTGAARAIRPAAVWTSSVSTVRSMAVASRASMASDNA